MDINVIKRDGTEESYDIDKVSDSIMQAALEVGGEDYELAENLAEQLTDILIESNITEIKSSEIEKMIQDLLIDEGHSQTATKYILFAGERNKQREMNTTIMRIYEDITFKSSEESDVKRENANIDSNSSMGTMLKYGSEGAKAFNLAYMIDPKIAKAHKNGDIHIHDLDFYTLTETCVTDDTEVLVRLDGKETVITVEELAKQFKGTEELDKVVDTAGKLQIKSRDGFVDVMNIVVHSALGKKVIKINTSEKSLKVTDDHRVTIVKDKCTHDIKARDLEVGNTLLVLENDTLKETPIMSIEEVEYEGLVYDMETADNHFLANNILVHNCCQIPLDKLFEGGFNTGHGFLREPGNIRTAGALAAIAIQSNQNDQHKLVA